MAQEDITPPSSPKNPSHPATRLGSESIQHRLDQIARVQARGVGDHISLPQIVVCGDQSVGKSSVLEGITGVPFPRKDGLCTKFPTEIILRHVPDRKVSIVALIIPHASRNESEAAKLKTYTRSLAGYAELGEVIDEVSQWMGLKSDTTSISAPDLVADLLRIEVTGSTGLHLTIVDLPGLIEGAEDEIIIELVGDLVDSYLENRRTIILAVLPASSDIETQPILRQARRFDKGGERTVGIITKVDLINRGTENRIAALVQCLGPTKIKLSFFLLVNPSPEQLAKGISEKARQDHEDHWMNG